MLTIHAGLAKTGTTSFQAELHRNREALRAAGTAYVPGFRDAEGIAHHALSAALLRQPEAAAPVVASFLAYLEQEAAARVLVSSEAFANAIGPARIDAFIAFLAQVQARQPVRLVLALRRVDSFYESMYLQSVKVGEVDSDFRTYLMQRRNWMPDLLRGLARLRSVLGEDALVSVRYRSGPQYRAELYAALNVPEAALVNAAEDNPRNVRLGLKAQVALRFLRQIGEKAGRPLSRARLIADFETGRFAFENDDFRYRLIGGDDARRLHEDAVAAAIAHGEQAYSAFFGDDIPPPNPPAELDFSLLTATDIERLISHATRQAAAPWRAPALQGPHTPQSS